MDDDFGDDADFSAAVETIERSHAQKGSSTANNGGSSSATKVQQPKPQALPSRNAPSSVLVSARQKGNPILNNIRSLPWEYADIPADYVLGNTTCALFLSLKYHRLHPEYIYSRIRALQGKYNLRILLTMVDIQNHEESLKELSKTSLVNNLTLILCWSAQEAGRYLELYKSYEKASPTSIRAHQSTTYADKLVEFITVPRSINKTDAVGLVSAFGSIRAAVNARPEEIGTITGWGEKKVQRWCGTVRENFRMRKAEKRGIGLERGDSQRLGISRDDSLFEDEASEMNQTAVENVGVPVPVGRAPTRESSSLGQAKTPLDTSSDPRLRSGKRPAEDNPLWVPEEDDEEALLWATAQEDLVQTGPQDMFADNAPASRSVKKPLPKEAELSEGVAAALAKLRNQ